MSDREQPQHALGTKVRMMAYASAASTGQQRTRHREDAQSVFRGLPWWLKSNTTRVVYTLRSNNRAPAGVDSQLPSTDSDLVVSANVAKTRLKDDQYFMSNVLLVDTNFAAQPIYRFLVSCGHSVTVVGSNSQDALAKGANHHVNLDYSDSRKLRELIEDRKIEYLVPGCNDRSYLVCAELNNNGQFPGIDPLPTAERLLHKAKFRELALSLGVSTPRLLSSADIGNRWPVIVKPVDAYSGRGVTIEIGRAHV
jgi:hypothetical protein